MNVYKKLKEIWICLIARGWNRPCVLNVVRWKYVGSGTATRPFIILYNMLRRASARLWSRALQPRCDCILACALKMRYWNRHICRPKLISIYMPAVFNYNILSLSLSLSLCVCVCVCVCVWISLCIYNIYFRSSVAITPCFISYMGWDLRQYKYRYGISAVGV